MRSVFLFITIPILMMFILACSGEADKTRVTTELQKESVIEISKLSSASTPTQVPPVSTPTQAPPASTPTQVPPASAPTLVLPTSTPTPTQVPPTSAPTQVPSTSTPAPTQIPPTPAPTTVKVCDWTLSYKIQDGFIDLVAEDAPQNHNIQNLAIEFTPTIRGFKHPIFHQTGGFALHEYSKQILDVSTNEQQLAIPKAKTAYRMDLKVVLVGSTVDGRDCQQELHEAFTRSDDYYPSPQLLLPENALPNYEKYAEYLGKIPQPNAQSVVLATSSGDWNGNWETKAVRKVDIPISIGFFGDVGPEDYETIRDLLEILVIIAPDLDISYANSLEDVTLPLHFIECTEHLNRDSKHCRVDGPSGSLSGRLSWDGVGTFWIRISGQRFNRHTLTHEMGHALGLYHWNLENCSMGYGSAQTQWWSEWDLMAISALQNSASNWSQGRDSMRAALDVQEDTQWIRYTENPDLLSDTPDSTWVELANLLEIQAMEAIAQTEPK